MVDIFSVWNTVSDERQVDRPTFDRMLAGRLKQGKRWRGFKDAPCSTINSWCSFFVVNCCFSPSQVVL